MVCKFITCESLLPSLSFSAQVALRGVMLVRVREVCACPPSSISPKSILGTLGVTVGPYPKHAVSINHGIQSLSSFSESSYLKCGHYNQADRFRMVLNVTRHAGFHPRWF